MDALAARVGVKLMGRFSKEMTWLQSMMAMNESAFKREAIPQGDMATLWATKPAGVKIVTLPNKQQGLQVTRDVENSIVTTDNAARLLIDAGMAESGDIERQARMLAMLGDPDKEPQAPDAALHWKSKYWVEGIDSKTLLLQPELARALPNVGQERGI